MQSSANPNGEVVSVRPVEGFCGTLSGCTDRFDRLSANGEMLELFLENLLKGLQYSRAVEVDQVLDLQCRYIDTNLTPTRCGGNLDACSATVVAVLTWTLPSVALR
jgi:hypothetical protein